MDTSSLPFMQDYGLSDATVKTPLAQQSVSEFSKSITGFDLSYDTKNLTSTYSAPKSVWETIADSTSEAINGSSEFVWNAATGAWESTKSGVAGVYGVIKDTGSDLISAPGNILDGILTRGFFIFAILVIGFVFLAKSGFLKDVASIVGSVAK